MPQADQTSALEAMNRWWFNRVETSESGPVACRGSGSGVLVDPKALKTLVMYARAMSIVAEGRRAVKTQHEDAMSNIEWTEKTWNPVVGCTKVSTGCKHCFAAVMHKRLTAMGQAKYADPFRVVKPWPAHLDIPLRRKMPTTYFVNSMGDLFHSDISNEYIAAVWGVMAACPQHTFQVLTKRAERLPRWMEWLWSMSHPFSGRYPHQRLAPTRALVCTRSAAQLVDGIGYSPLDPTPAWPLPNVWLGVSVEDQPSADERIPLLLQCPAAVRFVSAEPLLDRVDFTHMDVEGRAEGMYWINALTGSNHDMGRPCRDVPSLDLVIAGGESGPGARPCDISWIRSIVEQCKAAGVACFVKQLGKRVTVGGYDLDHPNLNDEHQGNITLRAMRHSKGGDPSEWPPDLRVRELPS